MTSRSFRLPPPPPEARSFRSDALDEVRAYIAQDDVEHSRVVHGIGPLGYERHVVSGDTVALGWGRASLAQTIRGAIGGPVLHLSVECGSAYSFGRRRVAAGPGDAVFVAPECEFTRFSEPGLLVAMGIDGASLEREIAARQPRPAAGWTVQSRAIDLRGPRRPALEAAIADLAGAMPPTAPPSRRRLGEARLISLVADLLVSEAAMARSTPLTRARFADLESWIDAHLDEPITVGRLCRVAGVGDRSLQLTFASLRGVSPMRFVAERRLAAARRRLVDAAADDDVTEIATAAGFFHLGRFASLYREAYGESPSQTLRGRSG